MDPRRPPEREKTRQQEHATEKAGCEEQYEPHTFAGYPRGCPDQQQESRNCLKECQGAQVVRGR